MFSSYPFLPDFRRRFSGSSAAAEASTELIDRYMTSTGIIEVREGLFRGHHARLLFADGALQSAAALESSSTCCCSRISAASHGLSPPAGP